MDHLKDEMVLVSVCEMCDATPSTTSLVFMFYLSSLSPARTVVSHLPLGCLRHGSRRLVHISLDHRRFPRAASASPAATSLSSVSPVETGGSCEPVMEWMRRQTNAAMSGEPTPSTYSIGSDG